MMMKFTMKSMELSEAKKFDTRTDKIFGNEMVNQSAKSA